MLNNAVRINVLYTEHEISKEIQYKHLYQQLKQKIWSWKLNKN